MLGKERWLVPGKEVGHDTETSMVMPMDVS